MYSVQRGGGMPIFRGMITQRGRGFGSLLGGLMRNTLLPLAKTGVKQLAPVVRQLGRQAVRQGRRQLSRAIKDVGRGRTVQQAVVDRLVKPTLKAVQQQQRRLQNVQRQPNRQQPRARQRTTVQSAQRGRPVQTSAKRAGVRRPYTGKNSSSGLAAKRARQVKDIFG